MISKRKPKVIQSRHMTMTRFKDDFYHRWLYKNIDLIHAVTNQVKEQLIKYIPQEVRPSIEMIYLGVDEPVVNNHTVEELKKEYCLEDAFVVGIIGRIEEGKGQHLVIEAISKLKKLNIKALIVGSSMDESYLSELKKKVKDLGIEDKIIFTGFTKEINEHMQLCDVTVLATQNETFGLVVIESMVNKIPVIATNNSGPLEIIDNETDGLLFNHTSKDLMLKLELIYNDSNFKNKLSMNAYKKIEINFNKATQMKKTYKIINES
jgi:glycosyltransferase involved in cell wall biosynthesis